MKKQYKVMASRSARQRKLSQQKDMRKISASCSQDVESATVEELQEGMKRFQTNRDKQGQQFDKLQQKTIKKFGRKHSNTNCSEVTGSQTNLTPEEDLDDAVQHVWGEIRMGLQRVCPDIKVNIDPSYQGDNVLYEISGPALAKLIQDEDQFNNILSELESIAKYYDPRGSVDGGNGGFYMWLSKEEIVKEDDVFTSCNVESSANNPDKKDASTIKGSYDLDILINDVLDIACSNINEQYGEVNTQIFGPSTNLPFDKFYITQYDVGTYIVYVSDNNIYVEDGETYEISGIYRSLDDFREFIQRLNNSSNQMYDENYSVNAADNLPGPGDFNPPEYDEPDELESTEEIEVEIDTDITMNEDGSWEYDDESFADGTGTNGTWYSEDYSNVYLGDHNDIVEDIDDILMQYLPDEPGRYHISGIATLVFTIGNIFSSSTYRGRDEDDDPIVDTEVYTEDADVTFDFGNSYISNFSCDKI